jgi:hypothetical protein
MFPGDEGGMARRMARFRRAGQGAAAWLAIILIAAAAPAAALAAVAAPARAAWHKSVQVPLPVNAAADPNADLRGLACSGASSCVAGGGYQARSGDQLPMIATESSGKWARGFSLRLPANASADPDGEVTAVACPTSKSCVAAGSYSRGFFQLAFVASDTSGKWSRAIQPSLPKNASASLSADLIGVRCTAAGSCVAVGSYVDSKGHLQAMTVTEAGGTWGRAAQISLPKNAAADPSAELDDVGCPSGSCVAVGSYQTGSGTSQGMAVTQSHGTWGRATQTALPAGGGKKQDAFLAHVTCAAPRSCLAVGGYTAKSGAEAAMADTLSSGGWKRATHVPGPSHVRSAEFQAVSCGAASCLAVGSYRDTAGATRGLASAESRGTWGAAAQVSAPAGAATGAAHFALLDAVACTSAGVCTAVGAYHDGSGFSRALAAVRG